MAFVVGDMVGPYQLVEQLGQGGMATVFKAYHAALDRYVAIKVLHPAFMEDTNFIARFQREARVVARLEHPNIVPIYDFSEHQGRPYLVMKFIQGQTLKAFMTDHQMTIGEITHVVEAVGEALTYAHRQDILHPDIKPSNVMLAVDRQIYLADFGLARIASSNTSSLTSDMMVGTPQYISPEQAQSKSNIDGRTDVYSFGVMLYEMIVGRVPFSADTPFAVIHDHIYTPLPMPRKINPRVPEALERVLLKALAKDPENRFPSIIDLISAYKTGSSGLDPQLVIPCCDLPPVSEWSPADQIPSQSAQIVLPAQPVGPAVVQSQPVHKSPTPEQSRPPVIPPKQSWFSPARFGCCAGAAALFLLAALVVILFVQQTSRQTETRKAQVAVAQTTKPAAPEPTADPAVLSTPVGPTERGAQVILLPAETEQTLNKALEAWKSGDMVQAASAIESLYSETANNPAQTTAVLLAFENEDAWLLLCHYGYLSYDARPTAFTGERLEKLRMSLYYAAEDEQAGPILLKYHQEQLFMVPNLRFALLNDENTAAAQSQLNELLDSSPFIRRFPEALLLDAEFALKAGEVERAQTRLTTLMNRKDAPSWVMTLAQELKNEIP